MSQAKCGSCGATDVQLWRQYGMFFREVSDLHLGQIHLNMNVDNSGLGIRIDNNPSSGGARVTNIQIDSVSVERTGGHGVETYGVDGLTVGQFVGVACLAF